MLQRHQKASLIWFRPKHFLKSFTSFMALSFINSFIHLCIIIIFNCVFFPLSERVIKTQCGSGDSMIRTRHKSKILYLSPFLKAKWKNGSLGSISLRVHFLSCARRSRWGGPGGAGAAAAWGVVGRLQNRVRPGSPCARACRAVGVERGAAGAGAQPARPPCSALASPAGRALSQSSLPLSCRRPPG